jgi:two-component system, chemotaxis family, CheB/CheR fusion protein
MTRSLSRAAWPDLNGLHICIIEDNDDTRVLLSDVLQHCGAMVMTYDRAEAAFADLGEFVPSLFVCDLAMPGVDGLEFVRRVRALPPERGGRIPAIAITAFYEDYAKALAEAAGFNAYLIKPVKIDDLCQLVLHLAG